MKTAVFQNDRITHDAGREEEPFIRSYFLLYRYSAVVVNTIAFSQKRAEITTSALAFLILLDFP
jgi:hypothetical protein